MTTIRLLSAGLVATAMLIAPAMARQHHVTPRHQTESIDAAAGGRSLLRRSLWSLWSLL